MYRNLEAEMIRKGITRKDISNVLEIRYGTLNDKLRGKYPFKLHEAMVIRKYFFPDLSFEYLFQEDDKKLN